ncbi:MAG: hypothetical protein ACT443_14780 [Gemmatimonadota bacterium]
MTQRRYDDDEIAIIFANATQATDALRPPSVGGGLTLAELQEIGREVGLSAEVVAQAAARLAQPAATSSRLPATVTRRYFGLPIGVGRTVQLPQKLSDAEWELLVTDLRTTFDATGRLERHGSFRQWRNGNLRALIEPTETGERFRLETIKGSAFSWIWSGLAALGGGAAMFLLAAADISKDVDVLRGSVLLTAAGLGMFAFAALRLPSWARLRRQQIDNVIARLLG